MTKKERMSRCGIGAMLFVFMLFAVFLIGAIISQVPALMLLSTVCFMFGLSGCIAAIPSEIASIRKNVV